MADSVWHTMIRSFTVVCVYVLACASDLLHIIFSVHVLIILFDISVRSGTHLVLADSSTWLSNYSLR